MNYIQFSTSSLVLQKDFDYIITLPLPLEKENSFYLSLMLVLTMNTKQIIISDICSESNKIDHSYKVTLLKLIIEINQLLMRNILTKQNMEKVTKSN